MTTYYSKYSHYEERIATFRQKGGIYKHLFSLPYQWLRKYYECKILSFFVAEKDFPVLKNNSGIVVSLTSFPARIPTLYLVIKSLLKQTILPEKITLWLSKEEFPDEMADLPQDLKNLCKNGLEIFFVSDNLRSHKKYFYSFEKYRDKKVVTVDDDLIYGEDTLERLIKINQIFPKSVCANVIRKIAVKEHEFLPYKRWKKLLSSPLSESLEYTAIGYGGVLYPPNCFDDEIFNIQAIKTKAFFADDLWLKANELRMKITIASGGEYFAHPVIIPNSQKIRLQKINNSSSNRNNDQWQALCEYYDLNTIYFDKK
ncbi:MAG: hypothetical protein LBR81_03165 [Prevotellaceae bacterium]|jgi:hypothetical protein|nr:hypothetical protein [Prevotellaceae bacterium]